MKKTLFSLVAMLSVSSTAMAGWTDFKKVNPNPGETVTSLGSMSSILINWGTSIKFDITPAAKATLTNNATGQQLVSNSIELNQLFLQYENSYAVTVSFDELTQNGTYTLALSPGSFVSDEDGENPLLEFTYTVNDPTVSAEELPPLELISIDPPAGSAFLSVGTPQGREYTVTTNLDDKIGYATAQWYDVTDGEEEYIASAYVNHVDDNDEILDGPVVFLKKNSEDLYKMYEGRTYEMRMKFFDRYQKPNKELGGFSVTYAGLAKEYTYADEQLIDVNPNPDTFVINSIEDAHFTVTFDAPVEVVEDDSAIAMGALGAFPYASITPNQDKTEWTFVIPENVFSFNPSIVTCGVAAVDAQGRRVTAAPDMEKWALYEEGSYMFQFLYKSDVSLVALSILPQEGVVSELKSFTVSSEEGHVINCTYSGNPVLLKGEETVYTFDLDKDLSYIDADNTKMCLTMPESISTPGEYTLFIPKKVFSIFHEDELIGCAEANVHYTIEEQPEPPVVYDIVAAISPETGIHNSLKEFVISFNEDVEPVLTQADILDASGNLIANAEIINDASDNRKYLLSLENEIIEDGVYTLLVPQGAFGNDAFVASQGVNGRGSAEIKTLYTVKHTGLSQTDCEDIRGDVYDLCGVCVMRNASVLDLQNLDKGLYIMNGRKIAVK